MMKMKQYVLMSWLAYIGLMAASTLLQNLWLFFAGMVVSGVMLGNLLYKLKKNYIKL
ncbi:hypothetical protein [Bacillus stratosphericus]|uniref:hypothetical protein n=1 Tax=Bacillus stratosphericus TaxID=293386 RepID=UPI001CFBEBCD|nr:hypothetical protein [Bacillus stratosphericus]